MNSTALSTTSNSPMAIIPDRVNPIQFCETFWAPAARMCGAKTKEDGMAISLVCLQEGINFVDFGRRYHLIMGRPSMRSDAMLAEFRLNHGGDYEILSRTPELAAIKFIDKKGRTYECTFSWQEAQDSRWPWNDWTDHDKGLKDSWATPTDRKSMLFARLVSDSLRAICPELVSGIYTPEEMSDVIDVTPTRRTESVSVQTAPIAQVVETKVVEAEIVDEPAATVSEDGEIVEAQPAVAFVTSAQVAKISDLAKRAGMTDEKYQAMLGKRGVDAVEKLTREQAEEIIDRLESFVAGKK